MRVAANCGCGDQIERSVPGAAVLALDRAAPPAG